MGCEMEDLSKKWNWKAQVLSLVIFICLYHDHAVIVWVLQIICTLLALCTVMTGHRVRDAVPEWQLTLV